MAAAFGSGLRGAGLRAGFAVLAAGRGLPAVRVFMDRLADLDDLPARAGLRVEEVRAFTARRNFAMPGA